MNQRLEPVSRAERLPTLDALRGFALFGVLLAYAFWSLGPAPREIWTPLDRALLPLQVALVDGKFVTLFSFLFGLGFALFLGRATTRAANPVPTYRRRLLVLLAIGLAHAFLLRDGDILAPYAILGFFLLLFRNASNRGLAIGVVVSVLLPAVAGSVIESFGASFPARPDETGLNWFENRAAWVRYWYTVNPIGWSAMFALFLVGLWVGRRQFFENAAADARPFRTALFAGLLVGALGYAGWEALEPVRPDTPQTLARRLGAEMLWTAHCWGLAAFYASALTLWMRDPERQRRARWLEAVGRTALTNYLLQAGLIVPICFAFRLWDRVTPRLALALTLFVWLVQVRVSVWWLDRYQFGPAEWLWRSLTYGRAQPMCIGRSRR